MVAREHRTHTEVIRMAGTAQRIVVGVDGSPPSIDALRWALAEARLRGGELDVVHAWEYPALVVAQYGGVAVPVLDRDELEQAAEDVARRAVRSVMDSPDGAGPPVPTTILTRMGKASEVILTEAKGATMVVVGARGRGGFASLKIGSVSSQVEHHAPVPVVLIPDGVDVDA
jgi:nucleotide-binding universal stress UspA family protein